jgi:hypothetical protein
MTWVFVDLANKKLCVFILHINTGLELKIRTHAFVLQDKMHYFFIIFLSSSI